MTYGQAYALITLLAMTLIWVPMIRTLMSDKKER